MQRDPAVLFPEDGLLGTIDSGTPPVLPIGLGENPDSRTSDRVYSTRPTPFRGLALEPTVEPTQPRGLTGGAATVSDSWRAFVF